MYKVYSDNYLLYADNLDAYKIVSPQLQLELNKAGQFSFSIYPNHPCYGLIRKLKSVITVYQDNEIIFRGRVLNSEQGWHKEEKIIAEGELAFLNDSVIRPYDFQSAGQISIEDLFALFINEHNAQVDEYKRFKIGRVTVDDGDSTNDSNMISRANEDYDTAWNAITKKLLEPLGGYLIVRHEEDGNYIDYLDDVSILAAQTIEFGKNLTDVLKTVKGEDVVTAIIPLGAKDSETGERLTIASLNNDLDYLVNEDQAALYGRIFKTVVWDDVTLVENLLSKGHAYLTSIGKITQSIELKAVDISPLDADVNSFRIGTKVKVKSSPHDIDETLTIEKLSIDIMKPESNKLTLGSTISSFTEQSNTTTNTITALTQKVNTTEETLTSVEVDISAKIASDIDITAQSILQTIEETYYTKGDTDKIIEQTKTEFEQTNNEFQFRFTTFESDIQAVAAGADAEFDEIKKYIRFVDGNIVLGEEGNELMLRIQNDRISFLEHDIEVAYVSNKKLYVNDGTFINSMNIGNFGFFPRANGNLSLKKVGD